MSDISIDPGLLTSVLGPQITDWLQRTKLTPIASITFATCPIGVDDPLGRPRVDPPMRYQINTRIEGSGLTQVGYVVINSPHAIYVIRGTTPHEIAAVNFDHLRFLQGGTVRFPRRVNHPGNAPNPFFANAVAAVITS
jgi:hypothetical protein